MNGRMLGLLATVMVFAALAFACTTETRVLPAEQQARGVTVSGSGSVFGEPDVAVLTLGVQAEANTVGEARAQAAEAMEGVINALKDGGVAEEDIQTTRFSVQPRFEFIDERQELQGFTVDNIVTAKIRNIDDAGDLLDAALEAAGDRGRVENLQFIIDDPSALEQEARQQAMEEARQKAETLAEAGGVDLGTPLSISESTAAPPIVFQGAGAAELAQDEEARTPIEPGELEVQVQVQVVYELSE
ncbi:MAG: SIMPL domain-containing protein [Dehalococcoidia bacterium]|nr:SIMPL domain-containing protein [Dehalococcoidia bacterium]